jgi:hypothetical protein
MTARAAKLKPNLCTRVSRPYRPGLTPAFPLCTGPKTSRAPSWRSLFADRAVMAEAPETFTCSECGSVYEVTRTHFPEPVKDYAECVECGCLLAEWNTCSVPLYRLIRTPDGRSPSEKPMA